MSFSLVPTAADITILLLHGIEHFFGSRQCFESLSLLMMAILNVDDSAQMTLELLVWGVGESVTLRF